MIYDEDWVLYSINTYCASSGFLPCNNTHIAGLCLHPCIMCQLEGLSGLVLLMGVLFMSVGLLHQSVSSGQHCITV